MGFCAGCGNDVADPNQCPICESGRGGKPRGRRGETQGPEIPDCPRCNDPLATQDWEGTQTLSCPTCHGSFFPGTRGLESVLDKLRATVDPVDVETAMQEFKDRFTRKLPDAVRYKKCPVCATVMTRRAYGTVSGVIIDFCPDHGSWVDEAQFAALAEFICRGGDTLAAEVNKVRDRIRPAGAGRPSSKSVMDRFFGGK